MSDLNLDNIVGFKAVDKDGNEQNVTVDEMVDMVSTRMVMALSETSTFAAVAATGNDVYENELPTVTDAANVRVLQSSGDAAQMTMQSLASKLGGLLPIATTTKSGLIEYKIMRNRMQSFAFGNGTIYKLGNLTANYVGIILHGADIINGKIIDICIFKNSSGTVKAAGNNESWINLKVDSNKNICIMVPLGRIYYTSIESYNDYVLDSSISKVDSFPDDAIDILFT